MQFKDYRRFIVRYLPTGGEEGQPTWAICDRADSGQVYEAGYTQAGARYFAHWHNAQGNPGYYRRPVRKHRKAAPTAP